jgi:acyl-coenzyme A synthetase/AMP-(fatty) acid ligase
MAGPQDLIDWGQTSPSAIAVIVEGRSLTYQRLQSDVDAVHRWLVAGRCRRGARVGVLFQHEYWNYVAHLAAWRIGTAVLSLRPVDLKVVPAALGLDTIIGDSASVGALAHPHVISRDLTRLDSTLEFDGLTPQGPAPAGASSIRLTLTSGTTGRPQCVAWSSTQAMLRIDQDCESLGLNARTRYCSFKHIGTTGGFRSPVATWRRGGAVLLRGLDTSIKATLPVLRQSTVLEIVPSNLSRLLQQDDETWPGQGDRLLVVGGGRLSRELRDLALRRVAAEVKLRYGSTEAGSVAIGPSALLDRHPGAVGFVREGVTVEIVGAEDQPLPVGTPGIVRIKTPYMVHRYEPMKLLEPARISSFRNGWFYPGDEGVLASDGLLMILGRLGDVVNLGGAKVSLSATEQALENLPGVTDFCVLPLQLPEGDKLAIVVVSPVDDNGTQIHERIKKALQRNLPYMLIRVDKIERNELGKVPRARFAAKLSRLIVQQTTGRKVTLPPKDVSRG